MAALKLTIDSETEVLLEDNNHSVEGQAYLNSLFEGTAWIKHDTSFKTDYNPEDMFYYIDTILTRGIGLKANDYVRVQSAKLVDEAEEKAGGNDFKRYVLRYMNERYECIKDMAEGEHTPDDAWRVIKEEFNFSDFEEYVNELIKEDGLEFIFGSGFSLISLFNYAFREAVRAFLYNLKLYYQY